MRAVRSVAGVLALAVSLAVALAGAVAGAARAGAATEVLDVTSVSVRNLPFVSFVVSPPFEEPLPDSAFEVSQDGETLDATVTPLRPDDVLVAVTVDVDPALAAAYEATLRQAMSDLLAGLPPGAQVRIVGAGGDPVAAGRVGTDDEGLAFATAAVPLDTVEPPHQSLAAAMNQLAAQPAGQRILVFVTDEDAPAVGTTAREAAERVAASGVVLYAAVFTDDEVTQGLAATAAQGQNGHLRPLRGPWQLGGIFADVHRGLERPYRVDVRVPESGAAGVRLTVTSGERTASASVLLPQVSATGGGTPVQPVAEPGGEAVGPTVLPPVVLLGMVPALLGVLLLGTRRPLQVLFAGYAAVVPIGSGIVLPVPLPAPFDTLSTAWGIVTSAVLGLHLLVTPSGTRRLLPSTAVWMLFLALAGMTLAWSRDAGATIDELVVLVSLVVLYALVTLVPVTRDDLRRIGDAILVGAALACAYALYLLATESLAEGEAGVARFGREFSGPNHTAASLLLPLAIALDRAMSRRRGRAWAAYPAMAALLVVVIALTGSRAGVLAAAVVLAVVAHTHGRLRAVVPYAAAITVALALAMSVAPGGLTERLLDADSSGRTNIWGVGLTACREQCWTGSGWGTFRDVYSEVSLRLPAAQYLQEGAAYEAHNVWLQVAVETGLAGLALAATATALLARELRSVPRHRRAAAQGAFFGLLVTSLLLSNLNFKYYWLALTYASLSVLAEAGRGAGPDGAGTAERDVGRHPADRPEELAWTGRSS